MFKNQLQELAQRSCFNLPSYGSIREGPDHAPRFKAFVSFNGEIFESPSYSSTLRQAEHYAAEAALNSLSSRGSKSLTARVLDETGVYKNLLQETAHKAGLNLPVYTTVRSGPGHVPVFTCTVELAGLSFNGSPSKTKKQAEKNAAIAAWSSLKKMTRVVSTMGEKGTSVISVGNEEEEEEGQEHEQIMVIRMLSNLINPSGSLTTEGTQTKGRNHHQLHGIRRRTVMSGSRQVSMNIMNRNNNNNNRPSSSSVIQYSSFSPNSSNQQQLFSSDNTLKKKQNLATQSNSSSSFIDLLPPPPPRTTSKILPLTSTSSSSSSLSGDHYRRRNWVTGNSKFIARRRRDRDSSSPYLGGDHDHQDKNVLNDQQLCKRSQEDEEIATAAVQGESSTSTSLKKPALLPLHSQQLHTQQDSREQNHLQGENTVWCVSADQISCYCSGSATHPMRPNTYGCPSGFTFRSGLNPIRGVAPSVQIRSVIPVCASPPSAANLVVNHSNPSTQKLESEFSGKLKL